MGLVAVAHDTTPYFTLYDEDTWLKAADFSLKPGSNPAGNATSAAFSPSGGLLAIGHNNSPYLSVYATSDFSRVTLTGGNPAGSVQAVDFSPSGSLLAAAHSTSPYLTVYNTTTWTKVTLSGGNPANVPYVCKFSPSGAYLAVGHSGGSFLTVYNTSDWSKVTLADSPSLNVNALVWTNDSASLIVCPTTPSRFLVYSSTTWASVQQPAASIGYNPTELALSPDGTKLICGHVSSAPKMYNVADWTQITFNNSAPAACTAIAFAKGGTVALFGEFNSPYMHRLDIGTLLFSSAFAGGSPVGQANYIAVGSVPVKYLSTTAANPVRGPDGNAISGVTVRAHRRSDGAVIGSGTTAADGTYTIGPLILDHVEAQVVFLDTAADPLYNDLIVRAIPA